MDFLNDAAQWLDANEGIFSAIAALIVIGTVLITVFSGGLGRLFGRDKADGAATPGAPKADLPSKPSIAVLPFETFSQQQDDEALADGLTVEIISSLARIRQLFVIARNSSFTYKGRSVDVRDVARELGVRYVLEGSLRRQGERVRVNAQLSDASSGGTAWSERYDVPPEEIMELEDRVTRAIAAALMPALRIAEAERTKRSEPDSLDAWSLVNEAWLALQRNLADEEGAAALVPRLEKAIALDPGYALAHGVLAHAHAISCSFGHEGTPEWEEARTRAFAAAERALSLDPNDPTIHYLYGATMANYRETERAFQAYQKALALEPDHASSLGAMGASLIFRRRTEEAIEMIEKALRLSPREPQAYHWMAHLALARLVQGDTGDALELADRSLAERKTLIAQVVKGAALMLLGREEEARPVLEWCRAQSPSETLAEDYEDLLQQTVADDARRATLRACLPI